MSPSAALAVDVNALQKRVEDELEAVLRTPPLDTDRHAVVQANETSDAVAMVALWLEPVVSMALARSVLGGVQKRVSTVGPGECLAHMHPKHQIGAGSDGEVWVLESGQAAKIGKLHTESGDEIPDESIEHVLQEVSAARAAGRAGISPRVSEAWFCCSVSQCAYVILMDRIDGVEMEEWVKGRPVQDLNRMRERIEGLTLKLNGLGIFHNDLHERNVMVDRKSRPWIIDFSRCTFVDTMSAFRTKHRDVQRVRKFLSERYIPENPIFLTRYIAARLMTQGIVSVSASEPEHTRDTTDPTPRHSKASRPQSKRVSKAGRVPGNVMPSNTKSAKLRHRTDFKGTLATQN